MTVTAPSAAPASTATTARRRAYERLRRDGSVRGSGRRLTFVVPASEVEVWSRESFAAAGLGLALEARGWQVSIVDSTTAIAPGSTDVVLCLDPAYDATVIPGGLVAAGWVTGRVGEWRATPGLATYDLLLAGSDLLRGVLRENHPRVWCLPLGVDDDLFVPPRGLRQRLSTRLRPKVVVLDDSTSALDPFDRADAYARASAVLTAAAPDLGMGVAAAEVLEASASGALPVVSSALGLAELGLAALPVARGTEEQREVVARLVADPRLTAESALATTAVARERHTWKARASALDEILGAIALEPVCTPRLGFFPDYRQGNPYQTILYGSLESQGIRIAPVTDPTVAAVLRDDGGRLDGYVFHVHWTAPLLQSRHEPARAVAAFDRFREVILDLRARGGVLVWTVHNVLPHELRHWTLEVELVRFLAEQSDLIHVMSETTLELVEPYYRLPRDRVVVVPHSSYAGVYPDVIERDEARRRRGLHDDDIVLLMLGGIRPYKGLDTLLDAFEALAAEEPRLTLLVAGKPGIFPEVAELEHRCQEHPRIVASFTHVDDAALQEWYRAADIAVLPYLDILNSGSYHLATTFGVPVVAPDAGSLASLPDRPYLRRFTPGSLDSLTAALRVSLTELLRDQARALAWADAAANDPSTMSAAFGHAIEELLR